VVAAGVPDVLDPVGDRVVELLSLAARPEWHKQAACRGRDPALWSRDRRLARRAVEPT
jgi:hypothetical protein